MISLNRRTLLQGAGFVLGLPLLDAMIPGAYGNTPNQTKLAYVYFPHGAVMKYWSPEQTGSNFKYSAILQPLEELHDYTTIVSGLRNKGGESTNPHGIIEETWLTCVAPEQRSISADQIAAKRFEGTTPISSIELCGEPGGSINYRQGNASLPLEGNPRKVYYTMFGDGDNYEDRMAILEQKNSLLDYVMESTKQLNKKLDSADKLRVDEYLTSVRDIEKRIGALEVSAANLHDLPEAPLGPPDDFEELLDIQFEMMALAFQTGQTRIGSMRMVREASMRVFTNLGIDEAFHPLSHHQEKEQNYEKLIRVQRWQTERVAKFAKRLKAMDLLDDTIILYGSNMSNSDRHNNDPLPSVLIGKGGNIKGGQHLKYPQDTPHARLIHTMLDKAGVSVDTFADSSETFSEV